MTISRIVTIRFSHPLYANLKFMGRHAHTQKARKIFLHVASGSKLGRAERIIAFQTDSKLSKLFKHSFVSGFIVLKSYYML